MFCAFVQVAVHPQPRTLTGKYHCRTAQVIAKAGVYVLCYCLKEGFHVVCEQIFCKDTNKRARNIKLAWIFFVANEVFYALP